MKRAAFILIFLIVFAEVSPLLAAQETRTETVAKRTVDLHVKLVLLGFDGYLIDKDYLLWNSPRNRHQRIAIPGIDTDVVYRLDYEVTFARSDFVLAFVNFLRSIGRQERRVNVLWNESYFKIDGGYFLNYTHFRVNATNTYYPADDVERWLIENSDGYGGLPGSGYILVVADLSRHLPSMTPAQYESVVRGRPVEVTPHFYNKTYVDVDLGIRLNRRFMTAWGGHSRLYYVDLSAGPGHAAEQLPIQLALHVNRVDPSSPYGRLWLSQYVGDYVWGAVYNLFTPDLVYPINYAESYRIKILVIDNRTNRADPAITETIRPTIVEEELGKLLPFAKVSVEVDFARIEDYPKLLAVIRDAASPSTRSLTPIVDARVIYHWLSESGAGHLKDFFKVSRSLEAYDIPVFVFAFSGEYNFGFTYKDLIADHADYDRAIWGVALYDLALVSHSENDLRRGSLAIPPQPGKGFGFTNTIIHEVGHMVGLMHPFSTSFDLTENFVSSVMAYYPYEYGFSQFDRDALQRGYADLLIRLTNEALAGISGILLNPRALSDAKAKLEASENSYRKMDYVEAAKNASEALTEARRARRLGYIIPSELATSLIVAVSSLLIVGVLLSYLIGRRRARALKMPCRLVDLKMRCLR